MTPTRPGPAFATDLALSADNSYLYVAVPTLAAPGPDTSHIDVYAVGPDGSLTSLGATTTNWPAVSRASSRTDAVGHGAAVRRDGGAATR